MKTLHTVHPYSLNERTKFMNKDSSIRKLFPLLPRFHECFIDSRTRSTTIIHDLSSDIEIFFDFLKKFHLKYRSNESRNILESFEKRKLKLLGSQAQNLKYKDFKKNDLIP